MNAVATTPTAVRPAAARIRPAAAPAARPADTLQLTSKAKAQAAQPTAPDQTLWQKVVKRGMAGVGGTVGGAIAFVGIIAALEFGIGVPAAHAVLGFAAPLCGFAGAMLGGWLGFRQGKRWVG